MKQKACSNFIVSEKGIEVKGKIYSWEKMLRYHWLGEAQGERIGFGKYYDPFNPYQHTSTQIARIKIKKFSLTSSYINLELDKERVDELASLLEHYGVKHTSPFRLRLGI